ncbi:MAG: phospholipase D family protein [Oceanospirillaceae bacterium]|nr:phospholipase D family protein [Oceanospirillaceae bacterium]
MLLYSVLVIGCGSLPSQEGRTMSAALSTSGAAETRLGQAAAPLTAAHPGVTGIHPLPNPHDAFAARILLARNAERTLDVQYYIWHNDITGNLLVGALYQAAERGVRVRLLLDDTNTVGLDHPLAALNEHPRIEVRLFNPFTTRRFRLLGFIGDFSRSNRRMHNKSFTADNSATIIGGRNIGDEYFAATNEVQFTDLDVLGIGPVVQDVSRDFDRYWDSQSSYPVERVLPKPGPDAGERLEAGLEAAWQAPDAQQYQEAVASSKLVSDLQEHRLEFVWAPTRMVSDDPSKGLGFAYHEDLLSTRLIKALGQPQSRIRLVSPYFVPTDVGTRMFTDLAQQGVDIEILTNALEATDVAAVHAGYAKHRQALLEAGIRLYELKRRPQERNPRKRALPFSGSDSSLHAKTFSVDGNRIFVGSYNFDPRSAKLNTELGFLIESPELAQRLDRLFETLVPMAAYEVRLDDNGDLYWLERRDEGEPVRYDTEPNTSVFRRAGVSVLSVLPIDWML